VQRVQVLRRGNQYRIDAFVIEQLTEITVGLEGRDTGFQLVEAARVNVRGGHALHVGTFERHLEDFRPAPAGSDQADANAVIGSQHPAGRKKSIGRESGGTTQSFLHKRTSSCHTKFPPASLVF